MKDKLLATIKLKNGKATFRYLLNRFNIDSNLLNNLLSELKLDGKILQIGNKYMIFPSDLKLGNIMVSGSGNKYICYEGERISISSNFLNDVIMSDVVSFRMLDNGKAEIVSIVDRVLGKMTCTVMTVNGKKKIVPYRDGISITLPKDVTDNLYPEDIILVEVIPNEIGNHCDAKFIKKIGRTTDPCREDEITCLNYGFSNEYSDEFMEEIRKIPTSISEEDLINRVDFRNQLVVTIDGRETKDMDDAVYAERISDNITRVYVHIADVSHYVKNGSLVFNRACEHTTSVYTEGAVIHMLHPALANVICSLNPNEDRLTKTVIMDINNDGEIVDYNIVKSVINSKKKMAYEDVDEILLNGNVPPGYEEFLDQIDILREVASKLETRYSKNGKIDFLNCEIHKEHNSDGTIKSTKYVYNSPSRKIIEFLMIAANESVASWLYHMGIPAIYRILEQPDLNTINEIIDKLNRYGFNIRHVTNVDTPKNIQIILDRIKNSDKYPLVSQMLVMGMKRARYSVYNSGHYALSLDAYLHFTSPIRRLADLIVHMMVDLVLCDYDKLLEYDIDELEKVLEKLAVRSSQMERRADMAQADSERRAVIQFMSGFIGNEYEAVVSDIDGRIRLKVNGIDTYVDYSDFSDNFIFDKRKKLLYDTNSGMYVNFGTKLKVILTNANSANRSYRVKVIGVPFELNNTNAKKKKLMQNKK